MKRTFRAWAIVVMAALALGVAACGDDDDGGGGGGGGGEAQGESIKAGIAKIPGLQIVGKPTFCIAFTAEGFEAHRAWERVLADAGFRSDQIEKLRAEGAIGPAYRFPESAARQNR